MVWVGSFDLTVALGRARQRKGLSSERVEHGMSYFACYFALESGLIRTHVNSIIIIAS